MLERCLTCRPEHSENRAIALINVAIILTIIIITPSRILEAIQDLSGWLRDQGSFGAFLLFMATGELPSAVWMPCYHEH